MKVHVAGPYACGRFGHDSSVGLVRSQLKNVWPGAEISISDVGTGEFAPTDHDVTIMVGRNLFVGWTGDSETDNGGQILRYPLAMHWFDKRSYLLGVGIDAHIEPGLPASYLSTLNAMQLRTVRDVKSATILRNAGVTSPVFVCADLAYLTPTAPLRRRTDSHSTRRLVIGVAISGSDGDTLYSGLEDRVGNALASLEHHFDIRFISFERPSGDRLTGATDTIEKSGPRFCDLDLLVTSHVRCIVDAASMGIPFLALGADGGNCQRECRALDYPFFLNGDADVSDIAEAIWDLSNEHAELRTRLMAAASSQLALAQRTFQVLWAQENEPESAAPKALGSRRKSCGDRKLLLVWAAPRQFLYESEAALGTIGPFDAVTSVGNRFDHPSRIEGFVLEQPGIMDWRAFPEELRQRIRGAYDGVVVCHHGRGEQPTRNLLNIAKEAVDGSGSFGLLEYRLWTQTAHVITPAELVENVTLSVAGQAR